MAELDDLNNQLDETIRTLRDLTHTVADLDSEFLDKFVKNVDKNTKSVKNNTEAVDKNTKSVDKATGFVDQYGNEIKTATDAVKDSTKATKESIKAKQEEYVYRSRHRDAFAELSKELSSTSNVGARLTDKLRDVAGGSTVATASIALLAAGVKGFAAGMTSMTKDLYAGQRGAKVSAKALTEFADAVGSAAQGIGFALMLIPGVGIAMRVAGAAVGLLGMAAKSAAKANEIAAEQTDRLYKSFKELSQVGATTGDGMTGVFDLMQTLGMTTAELDELNEVIKTNSKTLIRFGATAGEGAQAFAQVAGGLYKSDLGRELEMLGISAKDQREAAMVYMNIQAKTGQMQLKSTQQLITDTAAFAKELDLAAKLTGESREDQAKAREAALTEERFRAAIVDARNRGDEAELARLKKAQDVSAMLKGFGDTRGATGVLQIAAGRGALTTPEAVAAEMTYGVTKALNNNDTAVDTLKAMTDNAQTQQKQLASTNRIAGGIEGIQTNTIAIDDLVTRMGPISDAATKSGLSIQEFLKTEQGRRMAAGKETEDMVDAGRKQQAAAMNMDSVVKSYNYSAELNKSASQAFASAVDKFAGTVGARGVAGGVPITPSAPRAAPGAAPGTAPSTAPGARPQRPPGAPAGGAQPGVPLAPSSSDLLRFTPRTGDKAHFDQLDPRFKDNFMKMVSEYGRPVTVTSGYRSAEEQAFVNPGRNPRARPGESLHQRGMAIDLSQSDVNGLKASGLMQKYGFSGSNGDPVHIQMSGAPSFGNGGIATGPKTGYNAVLHGNEAVVPLSNGKSIPVSMTDFKDNMTAQLTVMTDQLAKLDDLTQIMRQQYDVSSKILQSQHA